jgi:uncharacterized lipoprotein YehR (DUF1307 family)
MMFKSGLVVLLLRLAVTGLTASTTYTCNVKDKRCSWKYFYKYNTVSVTTAVATLTYCTSASTNTNDRENRKSAVGTINNASTGTGI